MLCYKCFKENENNALSCKHCGSKLPNGGWPDGKTSNMLLLVWVIVLLVTGMLRGIISVFCADHWYTTPIWQTLSSSLYILASLANILPALAVRHRPMRIAATIMAGLIAMAGVVGGVVVLIEFYRYR